MKQTNKGSKGETKSDYNNQSSLKKQRSSNKNILHAELLKFGYYSAMYNLINRER